MFHADDYLRLTATITAEPRRTRITSRMAARNTDVNALFERMGLSHLARRA
ncbi:hypothetical protein [Alkalicaulis satelles]|uniref:hypothetical protein n=1 Tax=Alkalicaulis satelles TaxID=2609175 RepID=UPI0018EC29A0|nr:hypothetical protein [Alkalicaulis satelles]